MLNTIHQYLVEKRNEKGLSLTKIESRINELHPELSMSDTKLSTIFKSPRRISLDELFAIVDAMDLDRREILAILGEQEYKASEPVDYKGATALIAEHNAQIRLLQNQYEAQLERGRATREGMQVSFTAALDAVKEAHVADLAQRDERYETAVKHLKKDFVESEANFRAAMKSVKWWRGVAVGVLGLVAIVIFALVHDLSDLDNGLSGWLIRMIKEGHL